MHASFRRQSRILSALALVACLLTHAWASELRAQSPIELLPPIHDDGHPPVESVPYEPAGEVPWYVYASPSYWSWPEEGFQSSYEIGISGSEGNSQTLDLRAGASWEYRSPFREWDVDLTYNKAESNSVETKNNALLDARHEWLFEGSPWTVFTEFGAEYDEFRAFDLRLSLNGGLGYRFIDTESTTLAGRFGAGVSREIGGPDNRFTPEAVLGIDYEHQITKRQKVTTTVDYFPDWGDFESYRLRAEAAWEVLLDEEANLSMKLAATDRYDSTPNGRQPNDLDYSLLLLWKP